jgi:broad-specificity NMP kinase
VVKYPEQAGQDWVDAHKRVCDVDKLKQLINEQDKLTVITGLAKGNQDEYLKIFDKIFLLQCSPEVLLERLKTRTTNVYAKTPEEQKTTLQNQKLFDSSMIKKGAIPIDNSKDSVSETALHLISQF